MAAYVRVKGLISVTIGLGMTEYMAMPKSIVSRRGRTSSGKRTIKLNPVDKAIVPNKVVAEWFKAALTMVCDVGAGTARRWKYH